MANLFLSLGTMVPVGYQDLNANDKNPKQKLGTLSFMQDNYGPRIFMYCRNLSGSSCDQGELQKRVADATLVSLTSGTTTSATKTGAGLTANALTGRILIVDDNNDLAGGAPEGESSPIVSNSATVVSVDPNRAFTLALAVSDNVRYVSFNHLIDAAAVDLASKVVGVCVGASGVSDNQYGWWQIYGVCPDVLHKASAAVTALDPVVADAASVGPKGANTVETWVGYQLSTHAVDIVSNKSPVFLQLYGFVRPIA